MNGSRHLPLDHRPQVRMVRTYMLPHELALTEIKLRYLYFSYVTHYFKHFIYLNMAHVVNLLFKSELIGITCDHCSSINH